MKYLFCAVALILGSTSVFAADAPASGAPAADEAGPTATAPEGTSPGDRFLHMLDTDHNGTVSKEEFIKPQVQQVEKQFDYMDSNHDGQVDAKEADVFIQAMQKRFQQMQPHGDTPAPAK